MHAPSFGQVMGSCLVEMTDWRLSKAKQGHKVTFSNLICLGFSYGIEGAAVPLKGWLWGSGLSTEEGAPGEKGGSPVPSLPAWVPSWKSQPLFPGSGLEAKRRGSSEGVGGRAKKAGSPSEKEAPRKVHKVTPETGWRTRELSPEGRSWGARRGDTGVMQTDWGGGAGR